MGRRHDHHEGICRRQFQVEACQGNARAREISQVIVPVIDGGAGVTGLCDIPGKTPKTAAATLRVINHQKLPGSVNWFRYRVVS
jgi:hypothetical protein